VGVLRLSARKHGALVQKDYAEELKRWNQGKPFTKTGKGTLQHAWNRENKKEKEGVVKRWQERPGF